MRGFLITVIVIWMIIGIAAIVGVFFYPQDIVPLLFTAMCGLGFGIKWLVVDLPNM